MIKYHKCQRNRKEPMHVAKAISDIFISLTDTTADNADKAMNWAIEATAYGQWDTAIYVLKGLLDANLDDTLVCG